MPKSYERHWTSEVIRMESARSFSDFHSCRMVGQSKFVSRMKRKPAMKRFEQNCLREYADVIKAAQLIAGGEQQEPRTKTFVYVN
jgi:hypothetical protein